MDTEQTISFYAKLSQAWQKTMAKLLPISVDTITTRFLLLFVILLTIPLFTLIIFTLNLLASHLDQTANTQINLSQSLFNQALDETDTTLELLSAQIDAQTHLEAQENKSCLKVKHLLCLRISPQHNALEIIQTTPGPKPLSTEPWPYFQHAYGQVLGSKHFLAIINGQLYRVRQSSLSSASLSSSPSIQETNYFYALPIDESLLNGIYQSVDALQTHIWILREDAAKQTIEKTPNIWLTQSKSTTTPLKPTVVLKLLEAISPEQKDSQIIDIPEGSFRVLPQTLYTLDRQPIARVLHILPLKQYQLLLSNYYLGIYLIVVISLLFSVFLTMAAARTITQPLLKLIEQMKTLNRENVMKENHQITIKGVLEIQQLVEAFNHMILRLRQEHKMKDNFVATLTHDLKVPLLAEKQTLSYFLKQAYGPLNPEQSEILSILQSTNQSCLSLVSGLLEVYRYEAGDVSLIYEQFNLSQLLETIVVELRSLAQEKSIQLSVQYLLGQQSTTLAYADPMEIKRVLHNLISNAITNTPVHGKIECKIVDAAGYGNNTVYKVSSFQYTTLKHPVKLDDKLLVVIQDSGIGFSNDDLPHLFKQFSASKGRNPMSIGLGLFNCYQVLRAHYNPLWVETTEGEGSAVSFLIATVPHPPQDRRMSRDRRQEP